jgi:sugar phosphate isomerase/epimerase
LTWLKTLDHPNLTLLLDVGHCLISGEDPAVAVQQAGDALGYVHFDDNDGVHDCHWPLLNGQLTAGMLKAVGAALHATGYDGALALELHPDNPDGTNGLERSRAVLEELIRPMSISEGS